MNKIQKNHRRGFIKGMAAGVVGAFFALRGAQPAQARAMNAYPMLEVRIRTPELYEEMSDADWERLIELERIVNGRPFTESEYEEWWILDEKWYEDFGSMTEPELIRRDELIRIRDGGNQTEEEQAEFDSLVLEETRLGAKSDLNVLHHYWRALRSVSVRSGQVVFVAVPYRYLSEKSYQTYTYFRLPDGTLPDLVHAEGEYLQALNDYQATFDEQYVAPRY
jgi:hypothetical protein